MACNPHVTPSHPEPGWQAWCIAHNPIWEAPIREHFWQAKNDKNAHEGKEPDWGQWQRGPAR